MPELPEVETFRRFLDTHALNQPIQSVEVAKPKILPDMTPEAFCRAVTGRTLAKTWRHGKNLFVRLSGQPARWLLFHFGMTGYLNWWRDDDVSVINAYGDPERKNRHIRVRFDLDGGGHLGFDEQRMFGKLTLVDDPEAYIQARHLGPDALTVNEAEFLRRLAARKGQIKPLLMDQTLIAGLGNLYADETLYQAGIHPAQPVADLSRSAQRRLHGLMQGILQATIGCRADHGCLPDNYLLRHRTRGGVCPRHHTPWRVIEVGGRTTYYCPDCQVL